jgi:hypothetical protein
MVTRTRWSLRIECGNGLVSCSGNKHHKQWIHELTGYQVKGPGYYQACFDLLRSLFQLLMQGYWYQFLPVDGMHDDISLATGIEWTYLLSLLTTGIGIDCNKGDISGEGGPCGGLSVGWQVLFDCRSPKSAV